MVYVDALVSVFRVRACLECVFCLYSVSVFRIRVYLGTFIYIGFLFSGLGFA